ncbi:restriction endonuclease subunit S [Tenacibaculum maritimum]|uniref:restriction endonuclease subunit S n=1 Tax=Tenacibaculum maritimum TaxID=107401 RepID=UPI0038767B3B
MSKLDKLLEGVDVEWKTIKEVFDISAGGDKPKKAMSEVKTDEFCIPILSNGIDDKALYGWTNKAKIDSPSLTISARGTIGWTSIREKPFYPIVRLIVLTPKVELNIKFAYYFMKTIEKSYKVPPAGIPQLTKPMIKDVLFPILCPDNPEKSLKIQKEIVRILDTFTALTTALTTELTTELTARKKQFEYYREQLLTFKEGEVEWKSLGEVGEFSYGYSAKAKKIGDARFVRISDINTNGKLIPKEAKYVDLSEDNKKYILKKNDLVMARTGATYGKTLIFEEDYVAIYAGFLIKLSFSKKIINSKFYWHFAQSNLFWHQANSLVSGGGQPQFNANALKMVKIPIPSLEQQQRIVNILDKFDILTTSISEGLPKEIELRQKQYEYYRNKLLTFSKETVEV